MSEGVSARDRVHVKYCRDDQCVLEYADPGDRCKNLDFLLDQVAEEAGRKAVELGSD